MSTDAVTPESFLALIEAVVEPLRGRALDATLERDLNARHAPGGATYTRLFESCRAAIAAGWMCQREAGGIRYGRVIKPAPRTQDFSVDVVDMRDVRGPHHAHPNGEIDLVMPLDPQAQFDGRGAGWVVYGPGSAHHPTVSGGRALVLYLLPQGAIDFSR
ncbi:MAG: DUF4863 family protein [Steroidobacteraceae bacterium]